MSTQHIPTQVTACFNMRPVQQCIVEIGSTANIHVYVVYDYMSNNTQYINMIHNTFIQYANSYMMRGTRYPCTGIKM